MKIIKGKYDRLFEMSINSAIYPDKGKIVYIYFDNFQHVQGEIKASDLKRLRDKFSEFNELLFNASKDERI